MIEVSCLKDLNAAKLFLGFRIGAIRRRDFAVFPVQGQRGLRRLKRYFGDKMSVGAQMVVVLKAIVERCVSLALSHPFEFSWLEVSQADVFHRFLLFVGASGHSLARWIVHLIVVAHRKNRQQRRTIFGFGKLGGTGTDGAFSVFPGGKLGNVQSVPDFSIFVPTFVTDFCHRFLSKDSVSLSCDGAASG